MISRFRGWAGWSAALLLVGCQAEVAPGPAVRFSLDNAALRDDIRQLHLAGYRNQTLSCDDHALSGTPSASPETDLPIAVSTFGATFPASAGDWVFYVRAGNDSFPIDGPKRLAEGCTAVRIAAGSTPEIEIRLHDLRLDYCGDGTLDVGEECDRGPDVPDDDCAADCSFEEGICGNRRLDSDETCDDGNSATGDGCDASCQTEVFVVPQAYLRDDQTTPRIAAGEDAAGNGGFVVTWTDGSGLVGSDTRPPGVVFGFFDERGAPTANPVGGLTEYLINVHLRDGTQNAPAVGWSGAGLLAAFVSRAVDFDVFMMSYGPSRTQLWADERHVPSSWSGVNDQQPVVGAHPEHDGYVVAWVTDDPATATDPRRGYVRVLDGLGEPATSDVPLQAAATRDDFLPAAAVNADGSFAVAWAQGTTADADIMLARFVAAGTPVGTPEAATSAAAAQTEPSLAFDADGRLLVVWADLAAPPTIRGRLYPPTGAAGAEFAISTVPFGAGAAESGRVTTSVAASDGTFLVVWAAQNDSSVRARLVTGAETFARNRFTGDDDEFLVAGPPLMPSRARTAITPGGVALVVWQDRDESGGDDPLGGIRGRILPVP
jgi:cysteine-rich repeat protein